MLSREPSLVCELSFSLLRLGSSHLALGSIDKAGEAIFAAANALESGSTPDQVPKELLAELMFYAGLVNLHHADQEADVLEVEPHLSNVCPPKSRFDRYTRLQPLSLLQRWPQNRVAQLPGSQDLAHIFLPDASLCRSGAYVATRAAGRTPMRGLARPSAEIV
jgi:hypothetical protein